MSRSSRLVVGWIAVHVFILPILLPFYLLEIVSNAIRAGVVWACNERRWPGRLFEVAEAIEAWAKRPDPEIIMTVDDVPPQHRRRAF